MIVCGAITTKAAASLPGKLLDIHTRLAGLLQECRPDAVAIESVFHAANARSALRLGHARGVAMLAAIEAGVPVFEYSPAEIKRAVVGYGRAEKPQVQHMVKLLLGLVVAPVPHDAADALAVAICHVHAQPSARLTETAQPARSRATSWRAYRPAR
jgi:crossover junction endodeoxyribonuclease RuvC